MFIQLLFLFRRALKVGIKSGKSIHHGGEGFTITMEE